MQWETVIGLEIHVQLSTQSKIFSGSSTAFGAEANTQASVIDLALPGVLPVFNEQALAKAVAFGLAIDAQIGKRSVFDRKNYFYPDLPKGYQVTQMDFPIVGQGSVDITTEDGTNFTIGVTRAHLEEDAGKSLHEDFQGMSGIDLNRAGTPLLEIVSEPDIRNAKQAIAYLKKIHSIITYIGVSDGDMSQGSMRCDVNISLRPFGQSEFGTRTELKNLNSFKFIEKAIHTEVERQKDILEDGGRIIQETRLYDADKDETRPMRSKEFANDYRYFPEPDLLPIEIDDAYIEAIRATLPELPDTKLARFIADFGLTEYDASVLTSSRPMANYFERVAEQCGDAKLAANWCMGDLSKLLNQQDLTIDNCPIAPEDLGLLLLRIKDNTISGNIAKTVFQAMSDAQGSADEIIAAKGLKQVTDSGAIAALVDQVIADNLDQFNAFKGGKDKLIGFFVGQVMKLSKGQANPGQVNDILQAKAKE